MVWNAVAEVYLRCGPAAVLLFQVYRRHCSSGPFVRRVVDFVGREHTGAFAGRLVPRAMKQDPAGEGSGDPRRGYTKSPPTAVQTIVGPVRLHAIEIYWAVRTLLGPTALTAHGRNDDRAVLRRRMA